MGKVSIVINVDDPDASALNSNMKTSKVQDTNMDGVGKASACIVVPPNGNFLEEYYRNNKALGVKNIQCFPVCISNPEKGIHKVGKSCAGGITGKFARPEQGIYSSPRPKQYQLVAFARFIEKLEETDNHINVTARSRNSEPDQESANIKKSQAVPSKKTAPSQLAVGAGSPEYKKKLAEMEDDQMKAKVNQLFTVGQRTPAYVVEKNKNCRRQKLAPLYPGDLIHYEQLAANRDQGKEVYFKFNPKTWHYSWRGGRYRKSFHCLEICFCAFYEKSQEYICLATSQGSGFRIRSNRILKKVDSDLKRKSASESVNESDGHLIKIKNKTTKKKQKPMSTKKGVKRTATKAATKATKKKQKPMSTKKGVKRTATKAATKAGVIKRKSTTKTAVNKKPKRPQKKRKTDVSSCKTKPVLSHKNHVSLSKSNIKVNVLNAMKPKIVKNVNHRAQDGSDIKPSSMTLDSPDKTFLRSYVNAGTSFHNSVAPQYDDEVSVGCVSPNISSQLERGSVDFNYGQDYYKNPGVGLVNPLSSDMISTNISSLPSYPEFCHMQSLKDHGNTVNSNLNFMDSCNSLIENDGSLNLLESSNNQLADYTLNHDHGAGDMSAFISDIAEQLNSEEAWIS